MKKILLVMLSILLVTVAGCSTSQNAKTDDVDSTEITGEKKEKEEDNKVETNNTSKGADSEPIEIGEELVPIGTVLKVGFLEQPIMVYGRMQQQGGTETIWDYVAVPYPQGNISDDTNVFFNHDQIVEIMHMGLESKEEEEFRGKLKEIFK